MAIVFSAALHVAQSMIAACIVLAGCFRLLGIGMPLCQMQIVQRLTVTVVDTFIADLKDAVKEAMVNPSGKGTMVALYGEFPCALSGYDRFVVAIFLSALVSLCRNQFYSIGSTCLIGGGCGLMSPVRIRPEAHTGAYWESLPDCRTVLPRFCVVAVQW
jgi:hypothetical protein